MGIDKAELVAQLRERLDAGLAVAEREAGGIGASDRHGATAAEARAERRIESAHSQRATRVRSDLDALDRFCAKSFGRRSSIDLGAIVDIEDDDGGRSIFLAPVGAGESLIGPGGDGFFSVVTPSSPIGRAVMGRRVGDVVEVRIAGDLREWEIVEIS